MRRRTCVDSTAIFDDALPARSARASSPTETAPGETANRLIQSIIARLGSEDPDELSDLRRRLQHSAARATLAGAEVHVGLERALGDLLEPAMTLADPPLPSDRRSPSRERRELARLARRIACTLEQLLAAPGEARIERSSLALRYARVDLAARARAVCAAFAAAAEERKIAFHLDAPPALMADVDTGAIEIVLATLLFSAFKHAPVNGHIECSLREDRELDAVLVRVADSGPPVCVEHIEALFDRTRQFDRNVPCDLGTVRLGLGVARNLVELHGGTLVLEKPLALEGSEGAVFRAAVPRRAPKGAAVTREAPRVGRLAARVAEVAARELDIEHALDGRLVERGERPLVLIVEDSAAIQRILVGELEPEHATVSAFDAESGLERAIQLSPDLIITDVTLPGSMDGGALISALQADRALSHVPVLVLTGTSDPQRLVQLLENGARDLLRKPFLLAELRARVHNLLESKRTRDVLGATVGQQAKNLVDLANEVSARQRELTRALAELELARARAERASQTKTNFLRMMSHELKTPLAALTLQMRIVERDLGPPSAKVRVGLDRMARSSRRMLHLVDTVLEWARIEGGSCQLTVTYFDLFALVSEVVHELRDLALQKGIDLVLHPAAGLAPLASDRRLVQLLALDLIGRAVRITDGGQIDVAVGCRHERQLLSVRDGSPPLDETQFEQLLDPLAFATDLVREGGSGSGLELRVMRDLASALDGQIRLHHTEGPGNTVVAELPPLCSDRTTARMQSIAAREGP